MQETDNDARIKLLPLRSYSSKIKGGGGVKENCQLLLAYLNIFKSNDIKTREEMVDNSYHITYLNEELDLIECNVYGDVVRPGHAETDPDCHTYLKKEINDMASINWTRRTRACDSFTEFLLVSYAVEHGLNSKPIYAKLSPKH